AAAEPPVAVDAPVPIARDRTPAADDSALFGLMLISFALVGFGALLDPGRLAGPALLEWTFLGALGLSVAVGAALALWRPRVGRRGMLALCVGAELVVVVALLITPDPSTRRLAATILVIPSLLIAAHLSRPVIIGQYLFAAVVCAWVGYLPGVAAGYSALAVTQLL